MGIPGSHFLLGAAWAAACILHSLLANSGVKAWVRQHSGGRYRYYRLVYNLFALVSFGLLVVYLRNLPSILLWAPGQVTPFLAWPMAIGGILIMYVSIRRFFLSFSGIQDLKGPKPAAALQTDGLHRFVRHPLYLGTFLFIWALFLLSPTASNGMVCLIITLYTLIGLRLEEKKLVAEFGQAYVDYQRRVPAIMPRLNSNKSVASGQ